MSDWLLSRYQSPHHRGRPPGTTHEGRASNPLCGDEATLWLRVENGIVRAAGWDAVGCLITHAGADLLCEAAPGRTPEDVASWDRARMAALAGRDVPDPRATCLTLAPKAVSAAREFYLPEG